MTTLMKLNWFFCRVADNIETNLNEYTIEFTFDADVACAVRIYLFAAENLAGGIAR